MLFRVPRDFTHDIYSELINCFAKLGYKLLPFMDFSLSISYCLKCVCIRHDVDRLPNNSLQLANLENKLGIKTSYYFRSVKNSYDENIIRQISDSYLIFRSLYSPEYFVFPLALSISLSPGRRPGIVNRCFMLNSPRP